MKKLIGLMVIMLVAGLFTGCGVFNLNGFVIPDDIEFINCIKELDTPKKIVDYIINNFEYEYHSITTIDPYTLWKKIKKGDCDIFSTFAVFVAHYNGYETYQIKVMMSLFKGHTFAVYKEGDKYSFSDNFDYYEPEYETFREIVEYFFTKENTEWNNYEVYDYGMNLIEKGKSK